MRRFSASLIVLLTPFSTFASEAVFDRLENDFQRLSYCVGFWNGIETAQRFGLDVANLAFDPTVELDSTRLALQQLDSHSQENNQSQPSRLASHLGSDWKMLAYFNAGSSETQVALRYSKRMVGMDIQIAAQKLVGLIQPVCAKAISQSKAKND